MSRGRRRPLVAVLSATLVVLAEVRAAAACDCPRPGTPEEELRKAALVFEGRAQPVERSGLPKIDTFTVTRSWKGVEPGKTVTVVRDGGNCTFRFEPDVDYLVFALRGRAGELQATICTLTSRRDAKEAERTIAGLGPSTPPQPASSVETATSAGPTATPSPFPPATETEQSASPLP